MKPERWQDIREILAAALEREPDERGTYIKEASNGDTALEREVLSLLESDAETGLIAREPESADYGSANDRIGTTVAQYRITGHLGEGGMGVVYRAVDTRLDRPVALKFLPSFLSRNKEAKVRFSHEARAAAALTHPNIATIYGIEEIDGDPFIVMEFVEGQELRQLIRTGGALPIDVALSYAVQIAEGLEAAHDRGVVHRDMKSANIMITDKGVAKIMDFGIAKVKGRSQITKEGATLGTIAYMSPEQARGNSVDHRADIWSFGVTLYEMIAGRLPFEGDYDQALVYAILNSEPRPITELTEVTAEPLASILDRALTKDPNERYQSMLNVLEDLRAVAGTSRVGGVQRRSDRHTVGREKDIELLQDALESAFSTKSLMVGLAGEAGIGKTTLVELFLDHVAMSGWSCLVAKGQCSERLAGTEALLPFLETFESLLSDTTGTPVAEIMREKAPWWYTQVASLSPDDPAGAALAADARNASQERVKRELAAFLQEVSRHKPLLFVFEDLHWADISSIDMLAYLAARSDAMRILLVATYRPADMRLADHPFLQIKSDLLSRGQLREQQLAFLPTREIERYLKLEYPTNRFPAALAKLIHDRTEGNPLFMVDLVRDLRDREEIEQTEEGIWQLAGSVAEVEIGLPDSIKGLITRKIGQLDDDDRRLMDTASVQGFEFDSAVVSKVLDVDAEDVEERLQVLEKDHRFVRFLLEDEYRDGTLTLNYRFVHALYQNELFAELTRTKRVRLSRSTAQILEGFQADRTDEVAAKLASLYETAREFEKAVDYYGVAAANAAQVFAYAEAIGTASKGLELLSGLPASDDNTRREISMQASLGGSLSATGGWADPGAGAAYTRVRELSKQLGLDTQTAPAVAGLMPFFMVTLQMQDALDLSAELRVVAQHENDQTLLGTAVSGMGMAEQFLGHFETASIHLEKVVEITAAEKKTNTEAAAGWGTLVYSLGHLALNDWILGYPDRAVQNSSRTRTAAEESGSPFSMTHYLGFAGFLYQSRGDVDRVLQLAETTTEISRDNALHLNMAWAQLQRGWATAEKGNKQDGLDMMQSGLEVWHAVGMRAMVPYWHSLMAPILSDVGHPNEGLALLDESLEVVRTTEFGLYESEVLRVRGEVLRKLGDAQSAQEQFVEAIEVARRQKARSYELRATLSLVAGLEGQSKAEEIARTLAGVYNWFTEGFDTKDLRIAKQLLAEID